jgi:hypothetical protein
MMRLTHAWITAEGIFYLVRGDSEPRKFYKSVRAFLAQLTNAELAGITIRVTEEL